MIWEWTFVIAVVIGALVGALVTAVILLDHHKKQSTGKWWEDE